MSANASPPSAADREALWTRFLQRWPIERLATMTLREYNQAGDDDHFCRWLEKHTEALGSIWGGSSLKFGIYSRSSAATKEPSAQKGVMQDEHYGWYSRYGHSAEEAFAAIRALVVQTAKAARARRLDEVEAVDLWPIVRRKIAFLYQDRENPCILPIYMAPMLRQAWPGPGEAPEDAVALYQGFMAQRGGQPLLSFADGVWAQVEAAQARAEALEGQEQLSVPLSAANIRNGQVKVPKTQRMFPADSICAIGERPVQSFVLDLPGGERLDEAWVLNDRHRIAPKMYALMAREQLQPGDLAVLTKLAPDHYQLSFEKQGERVSESVPGGPNDSLPMFRKPMPPLNQILFGPPGTGKTYATVDAALAVLDPAYLEQHGADRSALKSRFDELVQEHRIRFVTFHQSFSYEDFVEGLRATTNEDTGQIRYEVVDGVFKSLCEAAAAKVTRTVEAAAPIEIRGRRIWKMSLGNTLGSDAGIYDECIEKGYALLGYGGTIDFTGCTSRAEVHKRCVENGLPIENPQTDYTLTSVTSFVTRMKPGDLLVISDGNFKFRAIGEVSGEYSFQPHADFPDGYAQRRPVKWLRTYEPSLPHGELMNSQFSQMTLYELRSPSIDLDKLQRMLGSQSSGASVSGKLSLGQVGTSDYKITQVTTDLIELSKPNGNKLHFAMSLVQLLADSVRDGVISVEDIRDKQAIARLPDMGLEPYIVNGYCNVLAPLVKQMLGAAVPASSSGEANRTTDARVLIIDEINRGNISRIFGELITLIEPSKRTGASEALEVVLPYSKKAFSVPRNVYLIGTMNTADRSLTGMDVALRRRFVFKAMPPQPDLLEGVVVEEVPIDRLLAVMNQRIEALLDRDHCLGHAYFMPLAEEPTLEKLAEIFRNQVLPLLQEYFFDDWQRIQWVLNDHRKPAAFQFISSRQLAVDELFGAEVNVARSPQAWQVNDEAFDSAESYLGVIDHREAQDDE